MDELVKAFRMMRNGNLNIKLKFKTPSTEFQYLINDFNETVNQLNELIETIYKQEIYAKQIELKHLQSQIKPHFLYNSFFTLSHLIKEEDISNAVIFSNYLGEYFKYITKTDIADVWL